MSHVAGPRIKSSVGGQSRRIAPLLVVGAIAVSFAAFLYQRSLRWVPDAEARVKAAQEAGRRSGVTAPTAAAAPATRAESPEPAPPDPRNGPAQEAYARTLADRQQFVAALIPAERAVRLAPSSASAHLTLAMVCATAGYPADSLDHYRRALALDPSRLETYQRLGDLQLSLGDAAGAEATFQWAIEKAGDASGPRLSLAQLYHMQKRSDRVLTTLDPVLKSSAPPVAALYLAGKACQDIGKTVDAEGYLRRAVEAQADFADAWHALGSIHANQGRYREGVAELKKAVDLAPGNATYRYALANAYRLDTSDPTNLLAARKAFEQTLELDPSLTIAHYYYGLALEQTGEPEAALREYQETLRQSPKFLSAGYRIGIVLRSLGKADESRKYMDRFGAAAKQEITEEHGRRRDNSFVDSAEAHMRRAQEFLKAGDRGKAVSALRSALERDPHNGAAIRQLRELGETPR